MKYEKVYEPDYVYMYIIYHMDSIYPKEMSNHLKGIISKIRKKHTDILKCAQYTWTDYFRKHPEISISAKKNLLSHPKDVDLIYRKMLKFGFDLSRYEISELWTQYSYTFLIPWKKPICPLVELLEVHILASKFRDDNYFNKGEFKNERKQYS